MLIIRGLSRLILANTFSDAGCGDLFNLHTYRDHADPWGTSTTTWVKTLATGVL